MKNPRIIPVYGLFALMLFAGGCGILLDQRTSAERKEDRRDARAERHLTRALWLNPDLLQTGDSTTATITATVAGDSTSGAAAYTVTSIDSLTRVVSTLNSALLFLDSARMADNQFAEQVADARINNALEHVRRQLCNIPPISFNDSICTGRAFITANGLRYTHNRKPQYITKIVREKCPPCIVRDAPREPTPQPVNKGFGVWPTIAIIGWLLLAAMVLFFLDERKKRRDAQLQRSAPR